MFKKILRTFSEAKRTPLYDMVKQSQGRMVDFAGYQLPVQFAKGIINEHLHCRQKASIFDVSHMGQILIRGPDRIKLLQLATVGSTERKHKQGLDQCYLTLFLNEKGGIIDDGIATILPDQQTVRLVVNGANKFTVRSHLNDVVEKQKLTTHIQLLENSALIAVQGPKSSEVMQSVFEKNDFAKIPFMSQFTAKKDQVEFTVTRSGYTGQDGFQISGNATTITQITQNLLKHPMLQWAGLGARDSLRLEAGLCLHGHDMTPQITPLEAVLMWTVYKPKQNPNRLKFLGEKHLRQLQEKVKNKQKNIRKRVGFVVEEKSIIRENCELKDQNDNIVGYTSSGLYSPSLKKSIGMAYVDQKHTKEGTKLFALQRNKKIKIGVVKMPFVKTKYYKGWKDF